CNATFSSASSAVGANSSISLTAHGPAVVASRLTRPSSPRATYDRGPVPTPRSNRSQMSAISTYGALGLGHGGCRPGGDPGPERDIFEHPAEIAETDGRVEPLGHGRGLQAGGMTSPIQGVVQMGHGHRRAQSTATSVLPGADIVNAAIGPVIEGDGGGHVL